MIFLKNRLEFRIWNADPGVPDLDSQHVPVPPAPQQDLATQRIFDGVGQQIADHLFQKSVVGEDEEAAGQHM